MRRKDREIKDVNEIIAVIDKSEYCNLGLSLNDMPYIVPLNFGYDFKDGKLTMYFHCAKVGKKLDIIAQNSNACFSIAHDLGLVKGEDACKFSMQYESVMGFGKIKVFSGRDEKRAGLAAIMRKYDPQGEHHFPDEALDSVAVFELSVDEFSGKRLQK